MGNSDWDDFAWQRAGTPYGDLARRCQREILEKPTSYQPQEPAAPSPATDPYALIPPSSERPSVMPPSVPREPMPGETFVTELVRNIDDRIWGWITRVSWMVWAALGACWAYLVCSQVAKEGLSVVPIVLIAIPNLAMPFVIANGLRFVAVATVWCVGYAAVITYCFFRYMFVPLIVMIIVAIVLGVLAALVF